MMQEFVARGIESGQNWMRTSCFFVALISLLCARSVYIMVSSKPERMQEDEKMIYERFYSGRKKEILYFILSVVFLTLFCFGAYKGYNQKRILSKYRCARLDLKTLYYCKRWERIDSKTKR